MTSDDRSAVDLLLRKYRRYQKAVADERGAGARLARAKLSGTVDALLVSQLARARARQRRISDGMTFANPLIWMSYKYRAYRREAQPILTVHDLRQHCLPAGYICSKRFSFLNERLVAQGQPALSDVLAFPDDMPMAELLERAELVALARDEDVVRDWQRHEFHVADGRVAKWENYVPSLELV